MKNTDIKALAYELLTKHGLGHYRVTLTQAVTYIGRIWISRPKLHLSARLLRPATQAGVRATILHEIAHTLAWEAKHSNEFKQKALEIGCPRWAIGAGPGKTAWFRYYQPSKKSRRTRSPHGASVVKRDGLGETFDEAKRSG